MKSNKPLRSIFDWKGILGIVLSFGLLYWALRDVDFAEVLREVRQANPWYFLLSVVCATVFIPLRAWRWRPLLESVAPGTSFGARNSATAIGFMGNNLLPYRMGEFARAYALARQEKISVVTSFASLAAERLFDLVALIVFLFVALIMPGFPEVREISGYDFSAFARTLGFIALGVTLLALALVFWPERVVRLVEDRVAPLLPGKVRRPLVDAAEAFLAGLSALRSPARVTEIAAQTVVIWLVNSLGFYLAFRAFDINVPFAGALFLQSMISVAVSLPSAPGFFGTYEIAARIVLVELFRVEVSKALGFAIGYHIGGFIPVTVIGLYYAWRLGLTWREVGQAEETVEEAVERELPRVDSQLPDKGGVT